MANIKQIKRRIKSAENISQITKAMQLVAASKMKKAQTAAINSKPYADRIDKAVRILAFKVVKASHPLLRDPDPSAKKLVIVVSTNKGLCGGLNTNLFRFLVKNFAAEKNIEFISVGKKGKQFIARWHRSLIADFSENINFLSSVPAVIKIVTEGYIKGEYGEVFIVYNNFISALSQEPFLKRIMPLTYLEEATKEELASFGEFTLEPSSSEILNSLLLHYLENQLRSAIYEAEASEHSARMIAMKNATDAAYDLIDTLTLLHNKARQEKITYEIADMVTARLSVN